MTEHKDEAMTLEEILAEANSFLAREGEDKYPATVRLRDGVAAAIAARDAKKRDELKQLKG